MVTTEPQSIRDLHFLSAADVMKILGYESRATFWQAVRANAIPHVRLGVRRCVFEESALRAWLASRTVGTSPEVVQ